MDRAEVAMWKITLIHHIEWLIALVNRTAVKTVYPAAWEGQTCQRATVTDTQARLYEIRNGRACVYMQCWFQGALTHKVIKVTDDTHTAIKPQISPFFFFFFLLSYLRLFHTWPVRCWGDTKSARP